MQDLSKAKIKETKIKEIFTSIQGEGLEVGKKHIFVRFCKCNLNCSYCDTDFIEGNNYSTQKLFETLKNIDCETISFTGGEPLVDVDFLISFLYEYKTKLNKKIYLETNGTMQTELKKIIDLIDVVSMDIKLESATGQKNRFEDNEEFLKVASQKEVFIKVVFDNSIKEDEIIQTCAIAKKYNTEIILQPKMPMNEDLKSEEIFEKFYSKYKNIRLVPQTHKFLNLA